MCGRAAFYCSLEKVEEFTSCKNWKNPDKYRVSYNVAPSTFLLTLVMSKDNDLELRFMKWGFSLFGDISASPSKYCINVRDDSLVGKGKPSFRKARSSNRCLILFSGYFEWQRYSDGSKKAFFIKDREEPLLCVAGIYKPGINESDDWQCAVLTSPSESSSVAYIHDRMPIVFCKEEYRQLWISPKHQWNPDLETLISVKGAKDIFFSFPVSSLVNSVKNNDEKCILPLESNSESVDCNVTDQKPSNTKKQRKLTSYFLPLPKKNKK